MQHIKRINDSTFHVTIGERVLEATCKFITPILAKLAVSRFLSGDPTPTNCRVTDITERLRLEAESNLISVSKELGCRGFERHNDTVIHLRHPFGLIHAAWSLKDHRWTVATDQDIYVCNPDTVSVRNALVFLLDDMTNKGVSPLAFVPLVAAALVGFLAGALAVLLTF